MYIGTTTGANNHAGGTFMDLAVFEVGLTAAQVLADYTTISEFAGDDQRIGAIPWLWTDDGDGVVESCIESGSSAISVAGGIPGSHRARTRYFTTWTGGPVYSCVVPADEYVDLEDVLFHDASGTATGSTDCGGQVDRGNPVQTDQTIYGATNTERRAAKLLSGKTFYMLVRIGIGGTDDLIAYQRLNITSDASDSEEKAYDPASAADQLILTTPLVAPSMDDLLLDVGEGTYLNQLSYNFRGYYAGSNTGNIDVDYFAILPEPLVKIEADPGTNYTILEGLNCKETNSTYLPIVDNFNVEGSTDGLDLFPNLYNMMLTISSATIANTLTFAKVMVTPRYALI